MFTKASNQEGMMAVIETQYGNEQRVAALQKGNATRFARCELRRQLREASTRKESLQMALAVIEDPAPPIKGMKVGSLLEACYRIGPVAAKKLLTRVRVSPTRPVGELTVNEKWRLGMSLRAKLNGRG